MRQEPRIVIISPARDEARTIEETLACLASQTLQPARWILVDDGSSDGTAELAEAWQDRIPALRIVRREDRGFRKVGPGVVEAFYAGFETVDTEWDYVCKLDVDMRFEPTYLEDLMRKFDEDPDLGVASGKVYRIEEGKRIEEFMIDEMTAGQFKCYRRACWDDIGGLVREVMWDGIDFHKARMAGWRTRSFGDHGLSLIHLRLMGSSEKNVYRGRLRWGRGQWFMGSSFSYLFSAGLFRMKEKPYVIGGFLIICGYIGAALRRMPRYGDLAFRKGLRAWQRKRLFRIFTRGKVRSALAPILGRRRLRARPSVLLVAHHCNPDWTSEALIGWKWVRELRERVDLHVATHIRNERWISAHGDPGCKIHYVDTEKLAKRINWANDKLWGSKAILNKSALEVLTQLAFDKHVTRLAKRLIRDEGVELIHRVSPISPRYPTRLGRLGVPLIVGPVNGGMQMPEGFPEIAAKEKAGFQSVRRLARLLHWLKPTWKYTSRILLATRTTQTVIPDAYHDRCEIFCENGVDVAQFDDTPIPSTVFRINYLGRLIPCKGVDMLLQALARMQFSGSWRLDVVGDGPERERLESLAEELELSERVVFHGNVHNTRVAGFLQNCDVSCLPSVRESGGSGVLEALAAGRPVIAVAHGGPAETLDSEVGILVPPDGTEAVIQGFADALDRLASDPGLRRRLGSAGRERIERLYAWPRRAERMLGMYGELLGHGSPAVRKDERKAA